MATEKFVKSVDPALNKAYQNCFNRLIIALRTTALYPVEHPLTIKHVKELFESLQSILSQRPEVVVAKVDDHFLLNEAEMPTSLARIKPSFRDWLALSIGNLGFSRGLSEEELSKFFYFLHMAAKDPRGYPDLKKALASGGMIHIKPIQVSYVKISEREKVTEKNRVAAGWQSEEKLLAEIVLYLQGGQNKLSESAKKLYTSLLSSPALLAQLIILAAKTGKNLASDSKLSFADSILASLKRVGDVLLAKTSSERQQKNNADLLQRLAKELNKQVKGLSEPLKASGLESQAKQIVNQLLELLAGQGLLADYEKAQKDLVSLESKLGELLSNIDLTDPAFLNLQQRLSGSGYHKKGPPFVQLLKEILVFLQKLAVGKKLTAPELVLAKELIKKIKQIISK